MSGNQKTWVAAPTGGSLRERWRRRKLRRIRLTGLGLGVIVMTLLILLAAINTGTNLLYLMVAVLLAASFVSATHGPLNLNRLRIDRFAPPEAHADRPTPLEIEIKNEKRWLSSYGLAIHEMTPALAGQKPSVYFLAVPARRAERRRMMVRFPRRGLFNLDRIAVVSAFPFGFIDFMVSLTQPAEVLVYPKIVPVEHFLRGSHPEPGSREVHAKGQGINLYAIREYVPGDSARSIHWRLSAKGTGIKVREFEHEEGKKIRLILDFPLPEHPTGEMLDELERAISITASLAKYFLEDGFETGLWTPAGHVPQGAGLGHQRRIMRALALAEDEAFVGERTYPPAQNECADVWISLRPAHEFAGAGGGLHIDPSKVEPIESETAAAE